MPSISIKQDEMSKALVDPDLAMSAQEVREMVDALVVKGEDEYTLSRDEADQDG